MVKIIRFLSKYIYNYFIENEFEELKSKIKNQKATIKMQKQEIERLSKEISILQEENTHLQSEINIGHSDSDSQSISESHLQQDQAMIESLRQKNKQISQLLSDIEVCLF